MKFVKTTSRILLNSIGKTVIKVFQPTAVVRLLSDFTEHIQRSFSVRIMGAKSHENQTIMTLEDKLRRIRFDFQNCFTVCASVAKEYKKELAGEKTECI